MMMNADMQPSFTLSGSVSMEPLPHMPTKDTAPGRLPLFSSWSLVQLGSSFLYSHSSGVNQVNLALMEIGDPHL